MKKILLLFCALLVALGSWADGLKVSTTESASAEYQYKIFCRNASSYYLGNTTNATNSGTDYGLFAFFADDSGDYANGYYIYSIFESKWVTYTAGASYSGGQDKVLLVSDKPSVPWNITADNTNNKYYDIRPFKTDKTVDDLSWNWHGGAASNTSHTMGFYSYTDGNSGWGIVLAGGSGSPVADRKVVALFNVPTDNNEYPLTSTIKVSSSTSTTPQYFVLQSNGIDDYGEALYKIQKAEGDGNYLTYQNVNTSGESFMFLNTSCGFYSNYTYTGGSAATSPYYNMFRKVSGSKPYEAWVSKCNDGNVDRYSNPYNTLNTPLNAKGSWNARWKVTEYTGYSAWQVVIGGATSGTITYGGSSLISGGTATQSNNGIFVLNATPTTSDFTTSVVDGYLIDPVITIDSDRKIIKVEYTSYTATYSTITTALSTAPEGIGYPTTTARTRLQAAIDAFDASKTIANFTALSTQYNSFLTNVVLPEGKVYTIQNYVKSPSATTYLKNEGGTLTIGTLASTTTLNNLWIVRKSGNTYVLQSAADLTKYIVHSSFTLDASGSAWTLSCGTEWPCISMYSSNLNGGRYVASNGSNQFGTAGGSGYYSSSKTQASGWSTDFKFVESGDYALYKVRIVYPSGSAPTVTYNATAYSNGSDFVAPTSLAVGDLTVSEIAGYTPTVTIDGDVIYVNYNMAVTNPYADTWNFDSSPWLLLNNVPAAIDNSTRTYRYNTKRINIATTYSSSVEVVFAYSSGSYRIDVAGVDLIDPSTGNVVKGDYHDGYSGSYQSNREYTIRDVAPGNYILRYISYEQSTSSAGNISVRVVPGQGFYRLKNVVTDKYLTATEVGVWNSSAKYVYANGNATDASTVIRLFDKDSNGTLYMYNQGYGFGWTVANAEVGGGVAWITNTPDKYVHWFSGAASGQLAFAICYGNGIGTWASYLNKGLYTVDEADESVIGGADATDAKAQWVIEPATSVQIAISAAGYATTYLPFAVTIPSGVKAYAVSSISGGLLNLTEIETTIPEGTPVILEGAANTYTFDITTGGSYTGDNQLTGTYLQMAAPNGSYILQKHDEKVGFYRVDTSSATPNIPANRAYLPDGSAGVKAFFFGEDDADAIKSVFDGVAHGDIYDLNGRKVSRMQKGGVYVVNGKKVIVK